MVRPEMSNAARSRLQVDERRAQLLDLALELFGDRTYDEISVDEVAKAAGVSKGLLYHYFQNKRAFYVAAVEEAAARLLAATEVDREGDSPTFEEMREGITRYLTYVKKHANNFAFLLRGGGVDAEVSAIVERTREEFVERIRSGVPGGLELSPAMELTVRGYMGYIEALTLAWVAEPVVPMEQLADMIVRQCMAIFSAV